MAISGAEEYGADRAGFLFRMFSTHPPTEERVKILRALGEML